MWLLQSLPLVSCDPYALLYPLSDFQVMMFCSVLSLFKLPEMCWNFSFVDEFLPVLFAVMSLFLCLLVFSLSLSLSFSGNHFTLALLVSQQEEERQMWVLEYLFSSCF